MTLGITTLRAGRFTPAAKVGVAVNNFMLPSSKYIFQKDDTVILLAKRDQLPLVENLFRISSI